MMANRSYVMMGSLSNFTVREVLDVVGLSRQHTVIELRGGDGSRLASINLKGGHLVQGDPNDHPRESLGRALRAPESCTFHVFRLDDADTYQSYGQLVELLSDERSAAGAAWADATAAAAAAPPAPPAPDATVAAAAASPAPPLPDVPNPPAPVAAAEKVAPAADQSARPASRMSPAAAASAAPDVRGVSLAVASPKGGAGKTTIALNLAISLAHRGLSVILIDADVNGDVLSLINQRGSAALGSYDLLDAPGQLETALRRTKVHGLRVLPATGRDLPAAAFATVDRTAKWRALVGQAMELADMVVVDCPAGMAHTTAEILQSVSHVLGVFQAETVASRSFEMFERGLAALAEPGRPNVAGVVINMLRKDAASARAYEGLLAGDTSRRVLETAITRSDAFDEAASAATPVRMHGSEASRKMAWLFDNLAAEVTSRLPLARAQADAAGSFML